MTTVFIITDEELVHRSETNDYSLKAPIIIAYYRFGSLNAQKMANYWKNRMEAVSEKHKDLVFAYSDSDQYQNQLLDYGFEFDWKTRLEVEPIVIAEDQNLTRYLMDSKLTTDLLQSFVDGFKKKRLIPHIRSQPIPDNTNASVKEVVGKTFKEMVIDNPNDVFIMMYAYWCGHCKEALPIWQKLGERLADEPNVDILQIDVTLNEVHKPFKTMNYPTIYWLAANDKYSPKKFLGQRSVHNFIEYVAKMSTKPLLKYDRNGLLRRESVKKSDKNEL